MNLFAKLKQLFERVKVFLSKPFQPATGDRGEAIARTRECLADAIGFNFENAVSYDGTAWKPLKYRVGKPLYLTGTLMRLARAAGGRATVTDNGIVASLEEPPYGIFHELGTRTIPARPFFGVNDQYKERLAEIWGDGIMHDLMMTVTNEASDLDFIGHGGGSF